MHPTILFYFEGKNQKTSLTEIGDTSELNSYTGNREHLPTKYEGFHNFKHTHSEQLNCHLYEYGKKQHHEMIQLFEEPVPTSTRSNDEEERA